MKTALKICTLLLFASSAIFAQSVVVDSLKVALASSAEDTSKISLLSQLSNRLNEYDLEQAFDYAYQALDLTTTQTPQSIIAPLYIAIGRTHANSGKIDSAAHYFEKSLPIYKALGDQSGQVNALSKLRWVANYLGEYEQAATLAFESLLISENIGDPRQIALARVDVGDALYGQEKYEESIIYLLDALQLMKDSDAPNEDLGEANQFIADTYMKLDEYEKALKYANESLRVRRITQYPIDIAVAQNTRGNVFKNLGRYEEAIEAYDECYAIASEIGYTGLQISNLNNLGDVYRRMEQYEKSLATLQEMQRIMDTLGEEDQYMNPEALFLISESYEGLGQLDSALFYYKAYTNLKDSVYTLEADARVAELQTQYETSKK